MKNHAVGRGLGRKMGRTVGALELKNFEQQNPGMQKWPCQQQHG